MHVAKVMVLVTGAAFDDGGAKTVWATLNLHRVAMSIITLSGVVSCRVTVHTPRMTQHWEHCFEGSSRSSIIVLWSGRGRLPIRALLGLRIARYRPVCPESEGRQEQRKERGKYASAHSAVTRYCGRRPKRLLRAAE